MPEQMRTKKVFFDPTSRPALKKQATIKKEKFSACVTELLEQPYII